MHCLVCACITVIDPDSASPGWNALSRAAMLCSRTEFKADQENVPILKR